MSLQVQNLTYVHPDKEILFQGLNFSVSNGAKCAVIGRNGCGKSTLLQIMAGRLQPASGGVVGESEPYFVPQHFGQYDAQTVAQVLGISEVLQALHAILGGDVSEENLTRLNDRWDIEERAAAALGQWQMGHVALETPLGALSGGEKTKVFLAGVSLHRPQVVLMDEPTNHLDLAGRQMLYDYMAQGADTMVVASHDRTLLNMMSAIYEMSAAGMRFFPMNYEAYKNQKEAEQQSQMAQLENRQKELKKARKEAREAMERQQKHNVRGEKQNEKKGIARIAMGNLRDKAEKSTANLNKVQQTKLQAMYAEISNMKSAMTKDEVMKIDFHSSALHAGKKLVEARQMNFAYPGKTNLWPVGVDFTVCSGERVWLTGNNGCGKSTLLRLMTGAMEPTEGFLYRADNLRYVYLDQEYSLVRNDNTILEQVMAFSSDMPEHELKTCLNRFLFPQNVWDKKCLCLSGGEKMRLALCCLMISRNTPDMIIADEPTNNIDLANVDILTGMLREYKGTLIVVSHDRTFIEDLETDKEIRL